MSRDSGCPMPPAAPSTATLGCGAVPGGGAEWVFSGCQPALQGLVDSGGCYVIIIVKTQPPHLVAALRRYLRRYALHALHRQFGAHGTAKRLIYGKVCHFRAAAGYTSLQGSDVLPPAASRRGQKPRRGRCRCRQNGLRGPQKEEARRARFFAQLPFPCCFGMLTQNNTHLLYWVCVKNARTLGKVCSESTHTL